MPVKKAYVFIDGSNFYHGLKQNNLFDQFSYKSFFEALSKEFEITRVYFYDAVKNMQIEPDKYQKQQQFHERLRKEIPQIVIQSRKLKYLYVDDRVENAKKIADFCKQCKPKVEQFLKKAGLQKI